MAVALTGLGRKAVDIGVGYAKERYQFGVLIGSFQGIQHGFATSITNVEGSHFLSSRAIAALEEGADNSAQLAGMAFLLRQRQRWMLLQLLCNITAGMDLLRSMTSNCIIDGQRVATSIR
ncbi:MAG: hypothetical protein CM15mP49_38280 [Actinomycetota bacterium]|nr:MAG: hypothetical protein CM15mP49_38280 [Actinomycetota bacterium]